MMVVAPLSARIVERIGTKVTVTTGMRLVTAGLLSMTHAPGRQQLRQHRLAADAHGRRHGPHHGSGHRLRHGLAARSPRPASARR